MVRLALDWFDRVTHQGVDAHPDPQVRKRVLLTNRIAITMLVICTPYVFLYAYLQLWSLTAAMVLVMGTGYVAARINGYGTPRAFDVARALELTNFAVSIGVYSAFLGHGSGTHLGWFAGACLPFLLCDIRDAG